MPKRRDKKQKHQRERQQRAAAPPAAPVPAPAERVHAGASPIELALGGRGVGVEGRLVCDFCSEDDPPFRFPCPSFSVWTPIGYADSGQDWAACPACADLVEAGQQEALLRRSLGAWQRMHVPPGMAGVSLPLRRKYTGAMQGAFWDRYRRTGAPKRIPVDAPLVPLPGERDAHLQKLVQEVTGLDASVREVQAAWQKLKESAQPAYDALPGASPEAARALEVQIGLLTHAHGAGGFGALSEPERKGLRAVLRQAETVFVAAPICPLIRQGAGTLPETPLRPGDLPFPSGFAYLAQPVEGLRAAAWYQTGLLAPDGGPDEFTTGLLVALFADHGPATRESDWARAGLPELVSIGGWAFGITAAAIAANAQVVDSGRVASACRLLQALGAFMGQTILVAPRHRPDRATRRRFEHGRARGESLPAQPVLRVVELRKRQARYQPPPEAGDDHTPVDWACRWLVRGHWRDQAVGPRGVGRRDHRLTWVHPHVKGPESRPLKLPRATVFDVAR